MGNEKREGEEEKGCRWQGLWKKSRGGDEILPYLSRQLHFVDFYLRLRGDMWDLLRLAFNWLSICQQFSPFLPFLKVPGEVWEYWLPLHQECKDGFQIECKEASRLPGVILHLQERRRRAPASTKYLKIDPSVQEKTTHQLPCVSYITCRERPHSNDVCWPHIGPGVKGGGRSLCRLSGPQILRPSGSRSSWPAWNKHLNELKDLIWLKTDQRRQWQESACVIGLVMGSTNE